MVARNAVIGAVKRLSPVVHLACQRYQSPAQFLQSANGLSGENAVLTAPLDLITTSSGPDSGSRSSLPSMVVASAKTIHQPTNLMKSLATCHVAQFLALVIGARLAHAVQGFRFQEASIAAEAQNPGLTPSLRRRSAEVKNAATRMETRTQWIVVIVVAKSVASVSGASGASAAPNVVVGQSRESSKSHDRQRVTVRTALMLMARKRL